MVLRELAFFSRFHLCTTSFLLFPVASYHQFSCCFLCINRISIFLSLKGKVEKYSLQIPRTLPPPRTVLPASLPVKHHASSVFPPLPLSFTFHVCLWFPPLLVFLSAFTLLVCAVHSLLPPDGQAPGGAVLSALSSAPKLLLLWDAHGEKLPALSSVSLIALLLSQG